jgi:radical SAM superfamily enzyme YgiQ (UPF0313 family)
MKKVPIVLGGVYATLCTDHANRHSGADVVISGDGIEALPPLLEDLFGLKHDMPTEKTGWTTFPTPPLIFFPSWIRFPS